VIKSEINFRTYISITMKTNKKSLMPWLMLAMILNSGWNLHAQTYQKASYSVLTDNSFMIDWLVLGPVKITSGSTIPDESQQRAAFDKNLLVSVPIKGGKLPSRVKIGDMEYAFKPVSFPDGIINFGTALGNTEYAIAFAMAEIRLEAPMKVLMGVGSDDDIKIFLNGVLVHSNWIARGNTPDDDIVALDLKKGSNQLLVEVQNIQGDWSFAMRKIGKG
jgi:hypothetical protein